MRKLGSITKACLFDFEDKQIIKDSNGTVTGQIETDFWG